MEIEKSGKSNSTKIIRVVVGPKKKGRGDPVFKIFNLEIPANANPDRKVLAEIFHNPVTHRIVKKWPKGKFLERMYHGGVIDPQEQSIMIACNHKGVPVEAAKVSTRFYGEARKGVFVNTKQVEVALTSEKQIRAIKTLKPRGVRIPMQHFNLLGMSDEQLIKLSKDRDIMLSLAEMKELAAIQRDLGLPDVTDVFLETFGCRWSEHCFHKAWKAVGAFQRLKSSTMKIKNKNMVSAFYDNAGGWMLYEDVVAAIKLETHNSPTQKETFGGQITKLVGVIRDLLGFGLGSIPIGSFENTILGEFIRILFPELADEAIPTDVMARETIRAIAAGGNPMGIPMLLARMLSHPNFGGKVFALGGNVGLTTMAAAKKGEPQLGDFLILAGNRTGNDGIHGATISSGEMTENVDTGDFVHVQIGNPYIEQPFMRAITELFLAGCLRAINDFGAAGIVSAIGEMAENCGMLVNLALVKLKTAGLANWQIIISESQERMAFTIIPEKIKEAREIFAKYGIEATIVGVATGDHHFKVIYDPEVTELSADTALSGEICIDVPYDVFDRCPPSKIEVIEPPKKEESVFFPEINKKNFVEMAARVVGHFDACNQSWATRQYDATVQARHWMLPLYGKNYNITTHLAAQKPLYNKWWGLTYSQSFSPPQFEVDPVKAATNAMLDAIVTQVIAGVNRLDICLADNFYTPNKDKYAWWHLVHQVDAIATLAEILRTPFITGKDSSAGSATIERLSFIIHVLCSVVITAMGKMRDVRRLIPHQWQQPGNVLITVGPRANTLSGSLLASSLGMVGNKLEGMDVNNDVRRYIDRLSSLVKSGIISSSVPINRGGLILRLFEGIEASGMGVDVAKDPAELFPESFGAALLEVSLGDVHKIFREYPDLQPVHVGFITPKKQFIIGGKRIGWSSLYKPWNTRFEKEVQSWRVE